MAVDSSKSEWLRKACFPRDFGLQALTSYRCQEEGFRGGRFPGLWTAGQQESAH